MGDHVYAFSTAGVSVTSYADMNTTAMLELPGYETSDPYYYDDVVEPDGDGDSGESSSSEGSPKEEG